MLSSRLHLGKNETACGIHSWQLARLTVWTDWQICSLNRSSAVNTFRLTPAFNFDQNPSIGCKNGEYDERYKHLYPLLSTSSRILTGVCIGALSITGDAP